MDAMMLAPLGISGNLYALITNLFFGVLAAGLPLLCPCLAHVPRLCTRTFDQTVTASEFLW